MRSREYSYPNVLRLKNVAQLSFKFSDETFNPMRRIRLFTVNDFFSYVGGVLGLFAGISVLSFFEIFYFFTLRVVSNFYLPRKNLQHIITIVRPAEQNLK